MISSVPVLGVILLSGIFCLLQRYSSLEQNLSESQCLRRELESAKSVLERQVFQLQEVLAREEQIRLQHVEYISDVEGEF